MLRTLGFAGLLVAAASSLAQAQTPTTKDEVAALIVGKIGMYSGGSCQNGLPTARMRS
jgi:hypothetical protein